MVSVLDIMDSAFYGSQRNVRDEVFEMDSSLRKLMDTGLTPDDMKKAQDVRSAVQAAGVILDKLFA